MKRFLLLVLSLIAALLLMSCDSADMEKSEQKDDEEVGVDEEKKSEEVKAKVIDSKYYKWVDESVDEETITVYAEIENTSDTSIIIGTVDVTYLDADGSVIAVNDAHVSPGFLNEGSTGYVATEIEDSLDRFEDLDDIEIKVSPEPIQDGEVVEFTIKDENLNVETWGQESAKISVTGFLENKSDIDFNEDDTNAMIGLYDEDDNFLAAESRYVGQEFSINANNETSFEIGGGSPLPPEVGAKIDRAKVKAIGVVDMNDFLW